MAGGVSDFVSVIFVVITIVWPCQDLGTGGGSEGKEAGRAIAMETMWLAYR